MLFTIKTLNKYTELKRYQSFSFIVIYNYNVLQGLRLSLFKIVLIPIYQLNLKIVTNVAQIRNI